MLCSNNTIIVMLVTTMPAIIASITNASCGSLPCQVQAPCRNHWGHAGMAVQQRPQEYNIQGRGQHHTHHANVSTVWSSRCMMSVALPEAAWQLLDMEWSSLVVHVCCDSAPCMFHDDTATCARHCTAAVAKQTQHSLTGLQWCC